MNLIKKSPIASLGYDFIGTSFIPDGMDEYFQRHKQNNNGISYRQLTAWEIESLVKNRNTSDNWNNILVSDAFNPDQVQNCKFYGLVRIGKLEPFHLEFHNLRRPVGLYNSTIISCDFGDNVVIDNVNYISHYITGSEVIVINVNEIATTEIAKFGTGILKDGEGESRRLWMEVCNENGARGILPFNGMLPGDAYIWSRHRDNEKLQAQLLSFTDKTMDSQRGYYGTIGDRTVIKNCKILKDVNIGSDAYLKGANKIKNVAIHSGPHAKTQIGEGCELVNGIVDYGCRVFYGAKAVRFYMASQSQLKYGARLINSYLGNNSTISCCEVLNSLILPFHEQHHNNSFLCAALLGGQTNMAAGATVGSNHNSRGADGELIAGRGFWPGLCVSVKHNSKFAAFTMLAKGDYPAELHIPFPFSLVSNDVTNDRILVMPAYWFMHNMYALARNSWKYQDRDKRTEKIQSIEYAYLAPDTIQEMVQSLELLELATGKSLSRKNNPDELLTPEAYIKIGHTYLNGSTEDPTLEVRVEGIENSHRPVIVLKAKKAYHAYKKMIQFNLAERVMNTIDRNQLKNYKAFKAFLPTQSKNVPWENVGGQLIPSDRYQQMIKKIETGKIATWEGLHQWYLDEAALYEDRRLQQAINAFQKAFRKNPLKSDNSFWVELLKTASIFKKELSQAILESREKDYKNAFRQMVYDSPAEMNKVIGALEDNTFIAKEMQAAKNFKKQVDKMLTILK